jgi:hypothetical protein
MLHACAAPMGAGVPHAMSERNSMTERSTERNPDPGYVSLMTGSRARVERHDLHEVVDVDARSVEVPLLACLAIELR